MDDLPDHTKEVARGSFWSFAGNMLFKLVSFFYTILVARAASQDDIGLFNLSLGIIGIVMVFSDLGIPSSLQRFIPFYDGRGEKGKIRGLFGSTYAIVVASSALSMAIVWLFSGALGSLYHNPRLPDSLMMILAYILVGNLFKMHTIFLQGRMDIRSMQLIQNVQNFLKLVLSAALFYAYGASVLTMTAGYVISFGIALLVSLPFLRRSMAGLPRGSERVSGSELLQDILPLGFMLSVLNSFYILLTSADRVLLGYMTPPETALKVVAIYSYAATLSIVLTTLPAAIESIFLPVISKLIGKGDMGKVREATDTGMRWMLFVTIPFAIVMGVFSGDILSVLYGEAYRPGALAMSLITLAFLVRCYSALLAQTIAAMRLVGLELKIYVIVAAVNVALNILLIPFLGMEGSALAMVASFIVLAALFFHYAKTTFGYSPKRELLKITLAGLAAGFVVLVLSSALSSFVAHLPAFGSGDLAAYSSKVVYLAYLGALMSLAGVLFALSCLALRCVHGEDISLLRGVLRKARVPQGLSDFAVRVALSGVQDRK